MPQIQGRLLHGGQRHAPDSGQTFARGAETCPRFRADLCTGGRDVPQIQGRLLHCRFTLPEISGRVYPCGGMELSYRIVCFKNLHPFFEEIVLMILDEGSTDA